MVNCCSPVSGMADAAQLWRLDVALNRFKEHGISALSLSSLSLLFPSVKIVCPQVSREAVTTESIDFRGHHHLEISS